MDALTEAQLFERYYPQGAVPLPGVLDRWHRRIRVGQIVEFPDGDLFNEGEVTDLDPVKYRRGDKSVYVWVTHDEAKYGEGHGTGSWHYAWAVLVRPRIRRR